MVATVVTTVVATVATVETAVWPWEGYPWARTPDPYHGYPPPAPLHPGTPPRCTTARVEHTEQVHQASFRYSPWSTIPVHADTRTNDHNPGLMTTSGINDKTDRKTVGNIPVLSKLRKEVNPRVFTVLTKRSGLFPLFLCAGCLSV